MSFIRDLIPVFVFGIVSYAIYSVLSLYARRKERMAIIEKLSTGMIPDIPQVKLELFYKKDNTTWAIRIGCLLVGIGIGICIASVVDIYTMQVSTDNYINMSYETRHMLDKSPHSVAIQSLYIALSIFFGGIGLLVSYFIESKKKDKDCK